MHHFFDTISQLFDRATNFNQNPATFLPRIASIFDFSFAWRLRKMLAGFVLLSAVIGMVVVGATIALSMPTWVTLAAYPTICSLSLLLCAALWNIRNNAGAARDGMGRQHLHS
jgi:hypothetical protein